MKLAAIVLAAGKGTRMKSARAKVLHAVAGRPMIEYPVALAGALGARRVVCVLGHEAGHLALGADESRAECFGLRSFALTARLLGASVTYARELALTYRYDIYPNRSAIYRVGGCAAI